MAWLLSTARVLGGDDVGEQLAATVGADALMALVLAITNGSISIAPNTQDKRRNGAVLRRLQRAAALDADACGPILADIKIDRGSFNAWLALLPTYEICAQRGFVSPYEVRPDEGFAMSVSPLAVLTSAVWGEAWSAERVMAHIARTKQARGMLTDELERGARLSDLARQRLTRIVDEGADAEDRFEQQRTALQSDIVSRKVWSCSADTLKSLKRAKFSNPMHFDALRQCFVVSPSIAILSEDFDRALQACKLIGQVRLCGSALSRVSPPGSRRVTQMSLKRAEEHLRGLCEAWRSGGGPMPKRTVWRDGDGARIAGTIHAAMRIWRKVTAEPAYARLQKPGRRRREN
jgi:hypothetical protein